MVFCTMVVIFLVSLVRLLFAHFIDLKADIKLAVKLSIR